MSGIEVIVKKGYKDTTVGIIPEEWEIVKFKNVFNRLTDRNVENNQNSLTISAKYGMVNQLEYFNKKISSKDLSNYYLLQKKDFAYNKSYSKGYPMGVIKPLEKYDKGVVSVLYICFRINNHGSNSFYKQYFESGLFNSQLRTIAQEGGRAHGLLNVGVNDFFRLKLPLPPLSEQQKIAEILTTVDEKIDVIDEQIKQTQELKKGLMQRLLTKGIGHVKFKDSPLGEIPESWEVESFDDVFKFLRTKSLSRAQLSHEAEGQYYIHYGDIHSTFQYPILDLDKTILPRVIIELNDDDLDFLSDGDLIIADASEDLEGVGKCIELSNVGKNKIIGGLHTIVCRNRNGKTINGFRTYLLKQTNVEKSLKRIATGASVLGVSKGNLSKIKLALPPLLEQQKISDMFVSIDEKTESLKSKKQTYQELKKGLMQKLLTGKIRVKV